MKNIFLLLVTLFCLHAASYAQGIWTAVRDTAPNLNSGVMLLLTDGSVIVTTADDTDGLLTIWNKLTPDSTGSYVNGKWTTTAPMANSRLYFSSQVLQNGKVYVAGGEYGSGGNGAEIYDPVADVWTSISGLDLNNNIADANSQLLPDGRVLQNVVNSDTFGRYGEYNLIYDPVSNTYTTADLCLGQAAESAWTKLPDNSILFTDFGRYSTERYIPSLSRWIRDAPTPVLLYDTYLYETGPGIVLPDTRVLFLGSNGNTALYTPSGDTTLGQWSTGFMIPDSNGTPDAPAAMMANGNVLFCASPVPNTTNEDSAFRTPTYFYEFDYRTDSFTQVIAPDGHMALDTIAAYETNMLDLPDGTVLFSVQGFNRYYIYSPSGTPVATGRPTVSEVDVKDCQYMITGTQFNGISQGAAYGDDWQMATNYPIVRLVADGHVYYARTSRWNRTGIQTGSLPDTVYFTLPSAVPNGDYGLLLSANGISSDTFRFSYAACTTGLAEADQTHLRLQAIPNPAHEQTFLTFTTDEAGSYAVRLSDICGRVITTEAGQAQAGTNSHLIALADLAKGIYIATMEKAGASASIKIVVE
jgi:hypothetical protein